MRKFTTQFNDLDNKKFEEAEDISRKEAIAALKNVSFDAYGFGDNIRIVDKPKSCAWDLEIWEDDELLALVEAKHRNMDSNDYRLYKDGGCHMETAKVNTLLDAADDKVVPVFYVATFTNNKFYVWDLNKCQLPSKSVLCNKTTAVNRGKVWKEMTFFTPAEAFAKGKFNVEL